MPDATQIAPDGGPVSHFHRRQSTACPTVAVDDGNGGSMIINRSDFDPEVHTEVKVSAEAPPAPSQPSRRAAPPPAAPSEAAPSEPVVAGQAEALLKMTIPALCDLPEAASITGASSMKKADLVSAILRNRASS